jgi:NADH-quinone oxidoreductase subunit L
VLRNVWLVPLIPAVSFLLILFFGKRMPRKGDEIGIAAVGLSFVLSVVAAAQWIGKVGLSGHEGAEHHVVERHVTWWQNGGVELGAGIHVDGLTIMMLLVVTFISLMVHVYSTGYMEGDRRYTYFYAALSLFTASMLLLVVADNLLQLLVGWELVGLCSFMLIGHWWEEKDNSDAAIKAFLTTRVGDVGLLIGIIILFFAAGTFHIGTINELALNGEIRHGLLLVAGVCLFAGVMGKSAQFPLHTWLPDAMAGPTPVSALIHAATMVVAGVYLVARVYGVFWEGFSIADGGLNEVALIGGFTTLIAAALAFVQYDIKRVLAYSTISQLGYMVMALGVGAWTAGIFHLFTHAFFKALLFLGAGSVSHGAGHTFDMRQFGGLKDKMPITFRTFVIGSIALAGIPPLAGFWSKDEILLGASENGFPLMVAFGFVTAFLTAAYMTRCCYLTFWGEFRGDTHHGQPHESPRSITVPLVLLAGFSVVAGFLNATAFDITVFEHVTEFQFAELAHLPHHAFDWVLAGISTFVALAGITVTWLYYAEGRLPTLHGLTGRRGAARAGYAFLVNKYYLDDLYNGGVIRPIQYPGARAAYWVNQHVIDGIVNAVGIGARAVGRWVYDVIDQKVVDGAVNGAGFTAEEGGSLLRYIQTGRVQQYAAVLFGATALFGLALVVLV